VIEQSTAPLLEARGLKKHFPIREGLFGRQYLRAVDGVDLELKRGETLGVVGESGCGKSTLARLLIGLLEPTAGEVRYAGVPLGRSRTAAQNRHFRRDVQIVFQDPYGSLNPRMTAGEIVERPLIVHGLGAPAERRQRVADLFQAVGLSPAYVSRYPHEFSGGQRQRIAIARALASGPRVILADEPTSSLDVSVQSKILNLFGQLQDALDLTYVFISHDMRVVRHVCDRVAVMYLGRIVELATNDELFDNPQHPYTRALLAAVPNLRPTRPRRRVATIEGEPPSPLHPPAGCHFHPRCPWAVDACRADVPVLRSTGLDHQAACHLVESIPPLAHAGRALSS
jgi:oligopeptide/dipeptide ABC transporter ATP-binding protein